MVDTKGERFENSFDPSLDTGLGIGDVSKLCDEPAHTIRFWEKVASYKKAASGRQIQYPGR
jgi:hypothetical protein